MFDYTVLSKPVALGATRLSGVGSAEAANACGEMVVFGRGFVKEAVPHSGMSLSFVAALLTEPSAQCPRGRRVRQQMKGFPADTDTEAGSSREQYARSGFDSRLNPRSCVVRPLTAAGLFKGRVSLADVFMV